MGDHPFGVIGTCVITSADATVSTGDQDGLGVVDALHETVPVDAGIEIAVVVAGAEAMGLVGWAVTCAGATTILFCALGLSEICIFHDPSLRIYISLVVPSKFVSLRDIIESHVIVLCIQYIQILGLPSLS
jgi:hypothetical protein